MQMLHRHLWLKIFFPLILIIVLVVGLSIGLTKKDGSINNDLSNSYTTDLGGTVFQSLLCKEIPSAQSTVGGHLYRHWEVHLIC